LRANPNSQPGFLLAAFRGTGKLGVLRIQITPIIGKIDGIKNKKIVSKLVEKKIGLLSEKAGFRRFRPGGALPPRLLAETKRGEPGRFLPTLFVFGACFLARATRKRV